MQNSKPQFAKASRTGWDSGGVKSEKRVLVKALFGSEASVGAIINLSVRSAFSPDPKIVLEVGLSFLYLHLPPSMFAKIPIHPSLLSLYLSSQNEKKKKYKIVL